MPFSAEERSAITHKLHILTARMLEVANTLVSEPSISVSGLLKTKHLVEDTNALWEEIKAEATD